MDRKKRQKQDDMDYVYLQSLKGKHIPLLTLDARWHELFPDHRKTREIRSLEKRLNKLIQQQGQTNQDIKDYEKAKKVLMENIVANMTDGHEMDSPIRAMKQDKNKKLMQDLNDKMEEAAILEEQLPAQIQLANKELLIACMKVCYQELMENTEQIEALDAWIRQTREELKDHILQKQDMEMQNTQIYKYMHKLLGPQVIDVFDREHKVWKGNLEENDIEES